MKNLEMVKVRLVSDYKLHSEDPITSNEDAVELLKRELSGYDREAICVLNLNAKGKPINASITSVGDINTAVAHPREIFKCAVLSSAAGIVLLHNHPSGDLNPSEEDITLTKRLLACGTMMGISLIDHIIIGLDGRYQSMKNMGEIGNMELLPFEELLCISRGPNIEILDGKDGTPSDMEIRRYIDGIERSIPLTRDEVCQAYFAQQRSFDREYVEEYLEEVMDDPKKSRIFKMIYDLSVKKVLSSEVTLQKLTAEFRRQKNKQDTHDFELLENVLGDELMDSPLKRKKKDLER